MTVRVAIDDARVLARLARTLEDNACTVRALSEHAFEITSVAHGAVATARMEVEFFLRAWQNAHPGVDVRVG